jgi:hypothetical protein
MDKLDGMEWNRIDIMFTLRREEREERKKCGKGVKNNWGSRKVGLCYSVLFQSARPVKWLGLPPLTPPPLFFFPCYNVIRYAMILCKHKSWTIVCMNLHRNQIWAVKN